MSRHRAAPPNPFQICAKWNERYPQRQAVIVTDGTTKYEAFTRSKAKVIGDKCPVIWLEGETGAVRLANVKAR